MINTGKKIRNVLRGMVRVHAGFAVVRIRSFNKVWPRNTEVDLLELAKRHIKK